jgi:hypothetical protein
MSKAAPISPFWEHLAIGQWLRVLEQDRVHGTITVRERFPDRRQCFVTLRIVDVEWIEDTDE